MLVLWKVARFEIVLSNCSELLFTTTFWKVARLVYLNISVFILRASACWLAFARALSPSFFLPPNSSRLKATCLTVWSGKRSLGRQLISLGVQWRLHQRPKVQGLVSNQKNDGRWRKSWKITESSFSSHSPRVFEPTTKKIDREEN